jgi:hypothetical protein
MNSVFSSESSYDMNAGSQEPPNKRQRASALQVPSEVEEGERSDVFEERKTANSSSSSSSSSSYCRNSDRAMIDLIRENEVKHEEVEEESEKNVQE